MLFFCCVCKSRFVFGFPNETTSLICPYTPNTLQPPPNGHISPTIDKTVTKPSTKFTPFDYVDPTAHKHQECLV